MQAIKKAAVFIVTLAGMLLVSGCWVSAPLRTIPAKLGSKTEATRSLTSLPMPKEKIVCAVYKFRDQTGQYKAAENGSSWSTAVTQGATSILTRALEDSKWFVPIEREGLPNLLNERKIIRSSRANYQGENEESLPDIPPLLYAGVLLEGGIISYETNIITGGAGLKYFGTGASGQYRQDQVTIYLRAVSTQNGRVLKTVYTTKTILSQAVDAGVFKFVELKKLLEAETGYSYNEPPQLCVTAAIEKAVESLIIEGIYDKLWELKNPEDMNNSSIKSYGVEKNEVKSYDEDVFAGHDDKSFGAGISSGAQVYSGDYPEGLTKPSFSFQVRVPLREGLSAGFNAGRGILSTERYFHSDIYYGDLSLIYRFRAFSEFSPYLKLGGGIVYRKTNSKPGFYDNAKKHKSYFSLVSGIGVDIYLLDNLNLDLQLNNYYIMGDSFDGVKSGKYNDYFWDTKAGLMLFF